MNQMQVDNKPSLMQRCVFPPITPGSGLCDSFAERGRVQHQQPIRLRIYVERLYNEPIRDCDFFSFVVIVAVTRPLKSGVQDRFVQV